MVINQEPPPAVEAPVVNCKRCGFAVLKPAEGERFIGRVRVVFLKDRTLTLRCKVCGYDNAVEVS